MFLTVLKFIAVATLLAGLYFGAHYLQKVYVTTKPRDSFTSEALKPPTALATAPQVQEVKITAPPAVITPSGPNPPNAQAPRSVTKIPEAVASDPYEAINSEVPVGDTMRHPENSFGPGLSNSGNTLSLHAGVSSNVRENGATTFSPEFAQNGGQFMDGVFAHSVNSDDVYSDF